MSKRSTETEAENLNVTTEATLMALIEQLANFVAAGTLDSRCAAKLGKRLRKESEVVIDARGLSKSSRNAIDKAFEALDDALRACDAKLLVSAQAALREADAASGDKP
ncbi:hypothetical protein [Paraburkholderia lycopersici]|nr:hypothetical protein [Paraburkholderia lycopersici]